MKKILFTIILVCLIGTANSQNITLEVNTQSIAEGTSVDLKAILDEPETEDVVINFDVSGTAINGLDYITEFVGKGMSSTVAGGNGMGSNLDQFNFSTGVFVDTSGNIYIADKKNHRIQKWPEGASTGITVAGGNGAGSAANQFSNPSNVYVDLSGNIYVADTENSRIQKWAPGATSGTTVAGGNGDGDASNQLYLTNGFFVESNGNIYVADGLNSRIQKWVPGATEGVTVAGGNGSGSAANQLNNAADVFVDLNGNIFIADASNRRIQKWAPEALEGVTVVSSPVDGTDSAYIQHIYGTYGGIIYFMYDWNALKVKIRKWLPGTSSSITKEVSENGYGSEANELLGTSNFFLDESGNIYVSDAGNHRIQKIQMAAKITIFAGETEGTLIIMATDDDFDEETETIVITPNTSTGYTLINPEPINLSITDNDEPPVISFTLSSATIVENSDNTVALTATPTVVSQKEITIPFTISGTAKINDEFTVNQTEITIPSNENSASIIISTTGLDDATVEILETIVFEFGTLTNATTETSNITLNLESDDNPSFTLSSSTTSIAEHESLDITATLDAPTSKDVVINIDLSGTALGDFDYSTSFVGEGTSITVAGGNGQGSNANQLSIPYGIDVDSSGNIYIADRYNHRIIKYAPGASSGTVVAGGNGIGSENNQFKYPFDVDIDSSGNIFVTDVENHRVMKWEPGASSGTVVAGNGSSGNGNGNLHNPYNSFLDSSGNLYVADNINHRIMKWEPGASSGTVVAGGNGEGSGNNQLHYPNDVFVDASLNIYVSVSYYGNGRVMKWAPGATEGTLVAGGNGSGSEDNQLYQPYGLHVDSEENIYVSDSNNRVMKWGLGAAEGVLVAGTGTSGSGTNQLNKPRGIHVDSFGNIYITDSDNNRIQKILIAHHVVIKAGQTTGTLTINGIEDDIEDEGTETIIVKVASAENADITNVQDVTISLLDNTKSFTLQASPFPGLSKGAVAWGDYDNDGDLDVAIMGQSPTSGSVTALYENENGVFVNTNQNFVKLYDGDISWVDINKDGWIDLVVSGYGDKPYTSLYINQQGSYFESTDDYGLPQLYATTVAWGDLDNDGDIDLAIAGLDAADNYLFSTYYREDNQNTFIKEINWGYQGFINGDMKIIDIDLDGDNDIVYSGENSSGSPIGGHIMNTLMNPDSNFYLSVPALKNSTIEITRINNTSQNRLSFIASGEDSSGNTVLYADPILAGADGAGTEEQYPKLKKGDISVADYNIDGLNDMIFTGENQVGEPVTQLYIQDSNGNFSEAILDLQGLRNSTATWVDYDMDGDLDLFLTGEDNTGVKTILYNSEIANKKNSPPTKITGLEFEDLGYGKVRLSWDKPADDFSNDLSYMLRLGTTPGGTELSNTESDLLTGKRLISKPGQIHTNFFEMQLDPGNYYWSVQAVDNGLKGGSFSEESTFTLIYEWKVLNQGGIVDRKVNGLKDSFIKLSDLDNDNEMDLIYGSSILSGSESYRFDGKRLIKDINSPFGNFGLISSAETGDLNGDGISDVLLVEDSSKLNVFFSNNQGGYNVQSLDAGLHDAKAKIVDLNNDGNPEIVLMGLSSSQSSGRLKFNIYEYNLADSSFTTTDINNIAALSDVSFDLGDIDNDGDIDFILSGFSAASGLQSFIYSNDTPIGENYVFTQTSNNLVGVNNGTSNLIDYDGDGDLDAVLSGTSANGDVFEIYMNKLNEGITTWPRLNNLGLSPMREGKVDLGDFNGDGYSDLLYSGLLEGIGQTTKLSQFDPSSSGYIASTFDVSDVIKAEVEFGDLDGDGDLDFVISGESKTAPGSYIFRTYINFRNESANVLASGAKGFFSKGQENSFVVNKAPSVPSNLEVINVEGGTINTKGIPVEFSWSPSSDDHTPSNGLTYALKIGTTQGGEQIMSPNSNINGNRKAAEKGNVEHNLKWKLRLPEGTYYCSVQAIDASYTGSEFSSTVEFEVSKNGLSIEDSVFSKTNLYPNPAENELTVATNLFIHKVEVFTITGKKVKAPFLVNKIDISNLSRGMYFIKMYSENKFVTKKFFKI